MHRHNFGDGHARSSGLTEGMEVSCNLYPRPQVRTENREHGIRNADKVCNFFSVKRVIGKPTVTR